MIEIPDDEGTVRIDVTVARAMTEIAETGTAVVVIGIGMIEVAEVMTGIAIEEETEIAEADVMIAETVTIEIEIEVVEMIAIAAVDKYIYILLSSLFRIKENTLRYI